jgi:hypothetical protein
MQDQYLQTVLLSPSSVRGTFGLGESSRLKQAIQKNTTYNLWNTDNAAANFDQSLYGFHPFYLQVLDDGSSYGVALMNSNAMAVSLWEAYEQPDAVSFQSAGGLLGKSCVSCHTATSRFLVKFDRAPRCCIRDVSLNSVFQVLCCCRPYKCIFY